MKSILTAFLGIMFVFGVGLMVGRGWADYDCARMRYYYEEENQKLLDSLNLKLNAPKEEHHQD